MSAQYMKNLFIQKSLETRLKFANLIEEIKSIPHLDLEINFDHKKAESEVLKIQNWSENILDMTEVSQQFRDIHKKNCVGRVIRGLNNDSFFLEDSDQNFWDYPQAEFTDDGSLKLVYTDFMNEVPYLTNWLKEINFPPAITRLMKLSPKHGLYWHSHHNGPIYHPNYNYGFIITVIKTNEKVINGVRLCNQSESAIYKNYEAGSTHLLNGWYEHEVVNQGEEDRYCLQHLVNLNDESTLIYLKNAVEKYTGPRFLNDQN